MANQIIIDIGAVANDGTGDPLRTAFNYVNNNFSNVWNTGLLDSNVVFSGNRILTINANGNLILAPNGIGKVVANVDIVPNSNITHSLGALNRRWNTVYTQYIDVTGDVDFAGDLTVSGNLIVQGNTIQIGNIVTDTKTIQLANTANTALQANGSGITVGANDNVATILYSSTGNVWTTNIGLSAAGNVTAPYFFGNGSQLTGINTVGSSANAQILFNDNGALAGHPGFAFNKNTDFLAVPNANISNRALIANVFSNNIFSNAIFSTNGSFDNLAANGIFVANSITATSSFIDRGTFAGDPVTGDGSLYVGSPSYTDLGTDVMAQFTGNVVGYAQVNLQNYGNSNVASGDFIITADNGNDSTYFINMGMTGVNWDGTQDNSLGNALGPNDGYLYVQDGDLVIGTKNSSINAWTFDLAGNLTVPGNVVPVGNNTQSLGNATNQWQDLWVSNATIYMNSVPLSLEAGNVLTVNGQPVLSNDSNTTINTSGNIVATNVTATEWIYGNTGVETQQLQFVDNIYSRGSVNILNNGDYLIYESTGVPFVPHSNNAEKIGTNDIRWGEIFGNSVYANAVITDDIVTDLGPATGNIVSNVRTWDSAGANLYVWFDANQTPEIVELNTISGGNVNGWTVAVDGGNQALITATNPAGYFSISTDQALTGSGTLTFTSPDYAPPVANPLTVTVGANNWTFDNTGNLILPSQSNIVGTTPNNAGHLQWIGNSSGDGFGYTTLELVPDDTVGSSQRIVIDPTAPGHIHIRAGGPQDNSSADLFLGGENSYFKVASGANAEVQVTSNSNTWVFGTDGNLQVPGNINGDNNAPLVIDGASSGEGFIRLPSASFGSEQIAIVNKFSLGNGIRLETNGGNLFFDNDADLSVTGNVTANYFIGNGSQLTGLPASYTDSNVTALLSNLGSNTISGTGNITTTANIAGQYVLGNAAFMTGIPASYGNANVATFLAAFGSNTISTTGNITAGNITGNINITGNVTGTQSNVDLIAGSYLWSFNNTGNLVLPGNTFAVNYANGTAVSLGGTYGNANVADFLDSLGSNSIVTTGNVTASNFIGNIQLTGNVQGTSANVELVAGSYTWTFDNTGTLTLPAVGGNEGAELQLAQAANSTLAGNTVSIDQYIDQIRFFEGGGSTRGVYIDLSQAAAGVGTLLNNRVSGFVNAGTFVTMDNIKATVTTTGNRGLSLATVSGSITVNIAATYGGTSGPGGASAVDQTYTTTPSTSVFSWNFGVAGEVSTYNISDITNGRAYRITVQIGPSYNNNMISIERLI